MPELPEVETIVRGLRPHLTGRTIVRASLSHDNVLDGVSKRTLLRDLRGRTITAVTRRAKHALVHTDRKILAVQPGMSGALLHYAEAPSAAERQYAVLVAELDDRSHLIYRDVRRIGTLRWLDRDAWAGYARRLGPEPLDPGLGAAAFADRLARHRAPIKKVLMDQRVVVGVGNIYANEALFAAGIDPSRSAADVARDQLLALWGEVRRILQAAIDSEGTTIRDYVTGTGQPGAFQFQMLVYGREGEPCARCGTTLAATHAIDARSTVFCWRCQR